MMYAAATKVKGNAADGLFTKPSIKGDTIYDTAVLIDNVRVTTE